MLQKKTNNTSVGEKYSQVKTKGRDLANKTREPFKEKRKSSSTIFPANVRTKSGMLTYKMVK
jgi:hypothetical protein